jgi:hypothetical protein
METLIPSREAKDFSSSLCVQTSSDQFISGGKARPGRDADHLPHLVPKSRMSRGYTPLPLGTYMSVTGHLYFFTTMET